MADDTNARRQRLARERLDQAARAAWLYYIAARTQDEIAAQLHVSRQTAQRLVARAVAEKLIKFRFDHPLGSCLAKAERLSERYRLAHCEVVPAASGDDGSLPGLAIAAAQYLETWLAQPAPLVIGFSTGRTLRAVAAEISPLDAPQHKLFSLCGTLGYDGRAMAADPVMRIAERTGAQCFPMTLPLATSTVEEKALAERQRAYQTLQSLHQEARCLFLGVGHIGWRAPLHQSGFITDAELAALMEAGAIGEIAGCVFDERGTRVTTPLAARITALWAGSSQGAIRVGIAAGAEKLPALRAALASGLLNGLITDEATATGLMDTRSALDRRSEAGRR